MIISPLNLNEKLLKKFNARIFFKREDLQKVRSFKIRGAFNKIKTLNLQDTQHRQKIICASAGNHAQGVAYSCNKLKIFEEKHRSQTLYYNECHILQIVFEEKKNHTQIVILILS